MVMPLVGALDSERIQLIQEQALHTIQESSTRWLILDVTGVPIIDSQVAQGLMQAQSLLVLDLDRCTRCDLCVQACGTAHDGVTRLVREGLRFDHYLVATSCRQCRDPLCMVGCPVGSIRRRETLEIQIEDWCIGCGVCAENCRRSRYARNRSMAVWRISSMVYLPWSLWRFSTCAMAWSYWARLVRS